MNSKWRSNSSSGNANHSTRTSPKHRFINKKRTNNINLTNTFSFKKSFEILFPSIPKRKYTSSYQCIQCPQQANSVDGKKRRRKINRLLNKMEHICLISKTDDLNIESPIINSKKTPITKTIDLGVSLNKGYNYEILKKMVNNDTSYYKDNSLNIKQNILLESMKTTFLCSNHCRFQPLLNVFKR